VTDCLWFFLPLSERGCSYLCARGRARAPVGAGKRLARDVVAMAAGEPAAPQAANEELTEFVDALKKEVRTGSRGDHAMARRVLSSLCSFVHKYIGWSQHDDTSSSCCCCLRGEVGQDRGQVRGDHARRRRHAWHVERRWSSVGILNVLCPFRRMALDPVCVCR
jgi:hypothetical protein